MVPMRLDQVGDAMEIALVALQAFQVAFLWLHDWVPLGRLNNIAAVQSQDSRQRLILVTILSSLPFSVGLSFSLLSLGEVFPLWLYIFLWVTYSGLFLGELRGWWVPYLFTPDARRAARYQAMFANTHSFLPQRNGISPNTLHVILHVTTAATLGLLCAMCFKT